MECLNKIELQGIVGVSRLTICGPTKVCSFSLMTEYCYKGNDGCVVIDTMWIQITACGPKPGWPDLDTIQKGSKVHVIGRLRCRRYTDASGIDRSLYEIVAQELKLLED